MTGYWFITTKRIRIPGSSLYPLSSLHCRSAGLAIMFFIQSIRNINVGQVFSFNFGDFIFFVAANVGGQQEQKSGKYKFDPHHENFDIKIKTDFNLWKKTIFHFFKLSIEKYNLNIHYQSHTNNLSLLINVIKLNISN